MSIKANKITPPEMIYHARRRIALIQTWTKDDTEASYLANERRRPQTHAGSGRKARVMAQLLEKGRRPPCMVRLTD